MPHEKREFVNGELYHVIVKRIGNELLFGDINDHYRGVFSIYEFNNANSVSIRERRKERALFKASIEAIKGQTLGESPEVRPLMAEELDKREKLVDILCFSLMPDHVHLLLRQLQDNGISRFMQKFGVGYACYFKEKYNQKGRGHFFQNRFVAVPIETDDQLKTIFVYIHTNALAIIQPNWKKVGIESASTAKEFLENYKWHSYFDYIGKKNFPSVTEREWLSKVMGGSEGCKQFVDSWLNHKQGLRKMVMQLEKTLEKYK